MFRFFIVFLFLANCVFAEELAKQPKRITAELHSDDDILVENLLEKVKLAVSNGDLKSYLSCMSQNSVSKNKRKIATLFMSSDLDMEIHKFELLDSNESSIEFFVNYTWYEDSSSYKIVSSVLAEKIDRRLVIKKEEILSKKNNNNLANSGRLCEDGDGVCVVPNPMVRPNLGNMEVCQDGNCGPRKKYVPKFNEKGQEILEGISLFNDENGNPSKNGIMWLDPAQLWRKFPDKYGVPKCARIKMGIE